VRHYHIPDMLDLRSIPTPFEAYYFARQWFGITPAPAT
jgi:hypothetical protein